MIDTDTAERAHRSVHRYARVDVDSPLHQRRYDVADAVYAQCDILVRLRVGEYVLHRPNDALNEVRQALIEVMEDEHD